MPLPKEIDERVRKRFDDLFCDWEDILKRMDRSRETAYERRARKAEQGILEFGRIRVGPNATDYGAFVTNVENLARIILDARQYSDFLEKIRKAESKYQLDISSKLIFGYLKGLKEDYEAGLLDNSYRAIETHVTHDYMSQAKQLLRGKRHQYDHVPAAVLAGAVLEKELRSLCDRQNPPIPTEKSNGKRKTLGSLIDDLHSGEVFKTPLATMLKSYAQIRNAAAHGEFDKFTRQDVESMIPGINDFLADYQ